MTEAEYNSWIDASVRGGGVPRWNGSPYYSAKIPDLIGFKDRKYIDHTATHLHRGIGDLMRYAALISFAETTDFGPHHMLSKDTKRARARLSDEALYALASYIYSLKPPPNPNHFDEKAKAGEKVFARAGCTMGRSQVWKRCSIRTASTGPTNRGDGVRQEPKLARSKVTNLAYGFRPKSGPP